MSHSTDRFLCYRQWCLNCQGYSVKSKGQIILKKMVSNKVLEGHCYVSFAGMSITSGQTISGIDDNLSDIQTGVLQ